MTSKSAPLRVKNGLFALLLGTLSSGCNDAHKVPIPAEEIAEAPTPKTTASPASVAPPVVKAAAPVISRFLEPPTVERRTLAHILEPRARIGVYLGLPDGWRNDDPSYLLFFPEGKDPKPASRAVAITLLEPGLVEDNKAQLLRRGPEPTGLRDARWSPWTEEKVGVGRFDAAIATGEGQSVRGVEGPRRAIAVIVDVPGAPALGFIGSWSSAEPQHEAAVVDMVRALQRCQVEVGRGCVTTNENKRAAL